MNRRIPRFATDCYHQPARRHDDPAPGMAGRMRTEIMALEKQKLTAAEDAFLEAHCEALDLLKGLHLALYDLPAPCGEVPINWGHVGSLNEVVNRLKATLAFLNGTEE